MTTKKEELIELLKLRYKEIQHDLQLKAEKTILGVNNMSDKDVEAIYHLVMFIMEA